MAKAAGWDATPSRKSWLLRAKKTLSGSANSCSTRIAFARRRQLCVHDLHATMLALMGSDHERLTYHFEGRARRLTDVFGNVVKEIIE